MVYHNCSMPPQTWSTTSVACHHRYGLSQIPGCHLPGGLLLRLRLFPLEDLVPATMPFIGPAVSSAMRFFRAGVGCTLSSFLVLLNGRLGWRARYLRVNIHCSLASAHKQLFLSVFQCFVSFFVSAKFKMLVNCLPDYLYSCRSLLKASGVFNANIV